MYNAEGKTNNEIDFGSYFVWFRLKIHIAIKPTYILFYMTIVLVYLFMTNDKWVGKIIKKRFFFRT